MPREVKWLDPVERRRLYEEFSALGILMKDAGIWCAEKAKELGISASKVKMYLAAERDLEISQIREATATQAQRVANLAGATLAKAIRTLGKALEATSRRRIFNRDGQFVDEFEEPDWAARNAAAEKLLKLHGGFAPDKIDFHEVEPGDPSLQTDEQLQARLNQLRKSEPQK